MEWTTLANQQLQPTKCRSSECMGKEPMLKGAVRHYYIQLQCRHKYKLQWHMSQRDELNFHVDALVIVHSASSSPLSVALWTSSPMPLFNFSYSHKRKDSHRSEVATMINISIYIIDFKMLTGEVSLLLGFLHMAANLLPSFSSIRRTLIQSDQDSFM